MAGASVKDGDCTRRVRMGDSWATLIELPGLRLTVVEGPERGRKRDFALSTIRIGTAQGNDLVLRDSTVSRNHARLEQTPSGWLVADLGSSNGTLLDGVRVREGYAKEGSRIQVGETVLELKSRTENHYAVMREEDGLGPLVGGSSRMRELYALIRAVAPTPAPVLVQGESGTGKELAARAIHELSGRSGPLVVFDAAATSPDLIRSELFGHAKGAFTGAAESREGAFRRADGGTLFLDEFGELPLTLQPNLLRALESREVTPVGSDRTYPVDVRVVVATNRDLESEVRAGRCREDLYHRIAVVRLKLPPLRERREDVPGLVRHFAAKLAADSELGADVLECLARHDWPGNVRALRNTIERLGIVARGRRATPRDLDLPGAVAASPAGSVDPVAALAPVASVPAADASGKTLEQAEREAILAALRRTGGNKSAAARLLGIALTTLKRKLASIPDGELP